MALKFKFFVDGANEWRWNAQSGGNIIFTSGEGFEKIQKAVQTVRKNVVRDDPKLEEALVKALKEVNRNATGKQVNDVKIGPARPTRVTVDMSRD